MKKHAAAVIYEGVLVRLSPPARDQINSASLRRVKNNVGHLSSELCELKEDEAVDYCAALASSILSIYIRQRILSF